MKLKELLPFSIIIKLVMVIVLIFAYSCRNNPEGISDMRKVCFDTEVLPIFKSNCGMSGCHDGVGDNSKYNFNNYQGIMKSISPGNSQSSDAYKAITSTFFDPMPPAGPLSLNQRTLIMVWIEQGALETTCNTNDTSILKCDTTNVNYSGTIKPIINKYCITCHSNENSSLLGGGYKLEDSVDVVANSNLITGSVQDKKGYIFMPKGGAKLDDCTITEFKIWNSQLFPINPTCDTTHVTYGGTISTILKNSCLNCHSNVNSANLGGNYKLQDSLDVVSNANLILASVQHQAGITPMPKIGDQLDNCKIAQFKIWYNQLFPISTTCDTAIVTYDNTIWPTLKLNCNSCHSNANAALLGGGFKLQDSADVAANSNLVLSAIQHKAGLSPMPKGGSQLDNCKIAQFRIWKSKIKPVVVGTTRACFTRDVFPIIKSGCTMVGCHDKSQAGERPVLETYSEIKNYVQAGNPNNSMIYNSITATGGDKMPPVGYNQLTNANIDSIYNWISYGALNETCANICDSNIFTFTEAVWPIINTNCLGCHSGASPQGGINLSNYSNIKVVVNNGKLGKAIRGIGTPIMPPGSALPNCNILQIEKWIGAGALK